VSNASIDGGAGFAGAAGVGVDPWRLVQTARDAADEARNAVLFSLANGSIGVRAGLEERSSASDGTFAAEVWERSAIHYHERHPGFARTTDTRVPVPDATRIAVFLGDDRVDLTQGEWLAFERVLDMRAGCTTRRLCWRSPQGATVEITSRRVVPFAHSGWACIHFEIASIDYSGPVSFESTVRGGTNAAEQGDDPRIGSRSGDSLDTVKVLADMPIAAIVQSTRASSIRVACGQRHRIVCGDLAPTRAGSGSNQVSQRFEGSLAAGTRIAIEKFIVYAWQHGEGRSDDDLLASVGADLGEACDAGFDAIASRQSKDLADFWADADLSIDGDPALEQALRFNLFHVLQSTGRDGRTSTAAKGLAGEGYEGHYFWDTEAFVLPVLVYTAPALARSMLRYRIGTLARARAHAREMNHEHGALYAWRTISGDECSAHYPSGSAQYHINAAIAYALRLYIEATDDWALLIDGGAEMLFETARIWLQIGHFDARRNGAFCIHDVTGPDEYTALVDNNFYTNLMAQRHLRYAVGVARQLAAERRADFLALSSRIGLTVPEVDAWSCAAEAMYLHEDERAGVFAQDDTFLDKPVWNFATTPAAHHPLLLHYHPLTLYRHQVCKQADVVLGLVLAGEGVDRASKRRNFDYYEPITAHDSTLSASTFGILASEVGHADKAYDFFLDTLRVDLDDLHGNTSHGLHMAAMAGSWLALVWGFAGLRVMEGRLAFAPSLPATWRSYRFRVLWQQRRLQIEVTPTQVRYTLLTGAPIDISHEGEVLRLEAGSPSSRALSQSISQPAALPRAFEALIFDLDGVITDTARMHYTAWKRLADEIGVDFDETVNERLKGVDRTASLEILLERSSPLPSAAEKRALCERKNRYYVEAIEHLGPQHLLPGARAALVAARAAGLKVGLASVSRNAQRVVQQLGIAELFDFIADAATIARPKPDPEIFLQVASALGVAPAACLGIDDAVAGVAAIKAAGMTALGIGDARVLAQADAVLPGLVTFDPGNLVAPAPASTLKERYVNTGR
jgi:alpha,alpha-trehalose phosphorylase